MAGSERAVGEDVKQVITSVSKVIGALQVYQAHNCRVLMIVTNHFLIHNLSDDTL